MDDNADNNAATQAMGDDADDNDNAAADIDAITKMMVMQQPAGKEAREAMAQRGGGGSGSGCG
jgi:hypothetical protein